MAKQLTIYVRDFTSLKKTQESSEECTSLKKTQESPEDWAGITLKQAGKTIQDDKVKIIKDVVNPFLEELEQLIKKDENSKTYYVDVPSEKKIRILTSNKETAYFNTEDKVHFIKRDNKSQKNNEESGQTSDCICYSMNSIVGVLRWKGYKGYDITLQIGSRFDDGEKTYMLQTMLKSAARFDMSSLSVPYSNDPMFNFMYVYKFRAMLKEAYKSGPYRTYVRYEKNDDRLRGTIDIARHIRENMGMNNGKIAYSYRELTVDNPINHLILDTYTCAKKLYPELIGNLEMDDPEFASIINSLKVQIPTFSTASVINNLNKCTRVIGHPYYIKYEELRKVCIAFLRFMGLSIFDGDNDSDDVSGVLFYVPDLWEEYIESCLREYMFKFEPQFKIMVCKPKTNETKGRSKGGYATYPDYVFFDNEKKPYMVLDAKYRKVWDDGFDLPDYTKCIRDMNSIGAHKTGVVYPKPVNGVVEDIKELISENYVSEYNKGDTFYIFPICIPSEEDKKYEKWAEELQQNVDKLLKVLKELPRE